MIANRAAEAVPVAVQGVAKVSGTVACEQNDPWTVTGAVDVGSPTVHAVQDGSWAVTATLTGTPTVQAVLSGTPAVSIAGAPTVTVADKSTALLFRGNVTIPDFGFLRSFPAAQLGEVRVSVTLTGVDHVQLKVRSEGLIMETAQLSPAQPTYSQVFRVPGTVFAVELENQGDLADPPEVQVAVVGRP